MYRFILLLLISSMTPLSASDLSREKRMYDEIVDAILDGDVEMMEADGHEFLSIYTEAEAPKGAVLILHGRGFHPDWADVVNPLRVGLAEQGWNTLSIQLPVLEKSAKYYDYVAVFDEAVPRIQKAIEFLQQRSNQKIIMLAHSCGVHMAMQYVRRQGEQDFDAFIGIGMGATDYKQPMLEPFPLEKIKKPLLDVFGGDDYPAVHRLAAIRAQQMPDEGNPKSRQIKIPEANHYFTDMGEPLLEVVVEWLDKL
jgi:pimeloyl-ACP methyl ester carboxylesterase